MKNTFLMEKIKLKIIKKNYKKMFHKFSKKHEKLLKHNVSIIYGKIIGNSKLKKNYKI